MGVQARRENLKLPSKSLKRQLFCSIFFSVFPLIIFLFVKLEKNVPPTLFPFVLVTRKTLAHEVRPPCAHHSELWCFVCVQPYSFALLFKPRWLCISTCLFDIAFPTWSTKGKKPSNRVIKLASNLLGNSPQTRHVMDFSLGSIVWIIAVSVRDVRVKIHTQTSDVLSERHESCFSTNQTKRPFSGCGSWENLAQIALFLLATTSMFSPGPSSHRTRSTSQHSHANYGTHCGQWECSHSLQAASKGLHANVLTRPVWRVCWTCGSCAQFHPVATWGGGDG